MPAAAQAVRVDPAEPTTCDVVAVEVERTFSEDCQWRAVNEVRRFRDEIQVALTPVRGAEECTDAPVTVEFRVEIGRLPEGEYVLIVFWTDQEEVDPLPIDLRVGAGACGGRSGFHVGDANSDGSFNIADPVKVFDHLFRGGGMACREAADADRSQSLDITDGIFALNFLFRGGPAPQPPFEECTSVPEASRLGCEEPQCTLAGSEPVWLAMPDGCVQCSPCARLEIADVVMELEAEGFTVLDAAEFSTPVCLACIVCPSGRFFRILVPEEQVADLELRGWRRLPAEDVE
jgi:ferredoxin